MPKVKLDDIEIGYEEQGSGERTFVFIHGAGGSAESWKRFGLWQLLPLDYHAYALDVRGHGSLFNVRDKYTYSQAANDIYRASQKLKLGKFICVGHSMGGLIALHLALEYPEVLKALIVLGGAPQGRTEEPTWKEYRIKLEELLTALQDDPKALRAALETQLAPFFSRIVSGSRVQEFLDKQVALAKQPRPVPIPGLALPEAKTDQELMDLLGKIKAPTLMIHGCTDRADMALRFGSAILGAKIVLFQGETHGIIGESPEKVVGEIVHFVSQLEKTGSGQ
jgi:pimeloyl-ACP methyl ester carboxylesterase